MFSKEYRLELIRKGIALHQSNPMPFLSEEEATKLLLEFIELQVRLIRERM